ncbi:MAG TPA: lipoprotein [Steroidobacteraceae bacterium]|nr:lipoprotein [Steroidobacteraceae bacterium]
MPAASLMPVRGRRAGATLLLAALLLSPLLAGCGQKGPLYLPAKPKAKVPAGAPAAASQAPASRAPAAPSSVAAPVAPAPPQP